MAELEPAFAFVLDNEGGLEDNSADAGGVSKFGISSVLLARLHPDWDVRTLTAEQARVIYLENFWAPIHGDEISDQKLANKLLDMTVNLGYGAAVKLLQRALGTPQDGILGTDTLKLLNTTNSDTLLLEIKARLCEYYTRTVLKNPTDVTFLLGWLRRAVRP